MTQGFLSKIFATTAAIALIAGAARMRSLAVVAVLNQDPTSPAWLVTVDLAAQRLTIQPLAELPKRDKAYELWLVAGGDTPPRSLGLLQAEQPTTLPVAAVLRPDVPRAAALAVSLEPAGGSPTGLPTGPVVYQGALLPLRD